MKPNPISLVAALLLLTFSLAAQNDNNYKLLLKSGAFIPEKNINASQLTSFDHSATRVAGKTFAVIQFEHIPSWEERKELLAGGIELLDYIPNNSYTVTISGSPDLKLLLQVQSRAVLLLSPSQKMHPSLASGIFPAWSVKVPGTVDVWLSFPHSFSYESVSETLKSKNFDIVGDTYKNYHIIAVRVPVQRLSELAALPVVEYMEPSPHEDQPLNNKSTVNARANILSSGLPGARNLHGEGIVIGIGDNADPLQHIDFSGRLINRAPLAFGSHGVHVYGIAGGAGIIEEKYTGYAPHATILTQAFSGILTSAPAYVHDYGMVITNNSYGNVVDDCVSFGAYSLYSRILDQQAIDMPSLQHVFAAGNSGFYTCGRYPYGFNSILGDYQSAKNVITVANTTETNDINSTSSRGPAKDGRIKPEISAQGTNVVSTWPVNSYSYNSGTSMASPAVAGGLALLYQRYRQLHGNANPESALMKALVCNGATDIGNAGPDYTFGFGWLNLLRSVKMLENNNYFNDSVANGDSNIHAITVPANTAQLKVMLYWNDPAAAILATPTLVNDLDLIVTDPSSGSYLPELLDTIPGHVNDTAITGSDHINNIEQVVIKNPAAGSYSIKIKGTAITQNPRQEYFVVYDTIPVSTTLTYPIGNEHFNQNDSIYISWDAYGDPANTYTLEYSTDNGSNWNTIDNNVPANLRLYKWFVPSVTTDQAKVRITRNGTGMISSSASFVILGVPTVSLAAVQCEGYISINWTFISGATDYEVMLLQGDQMVSKGITAGTTYTLGGLSKDSVYWISVRARLNGNPGRRATAISRQPNTGTCTGAISDNDLKLDAIVSPVTSGRLFTSTSLSNSVPVTIRIKNLDDVTTTGDITVSYTLNGGSPVTRLITNPAIAGGSTLLYTFTGANIDISAVGAYQVNAAISYPGDPVQQNDSLSSTFKQLDNPPIALTSTFLDDIESAPVQSYTSNQFGLGGLDRYDFVNSTVYGRIRTFVNTGIAYSGSQALTLDADRYVPSGNTDSLTGTFNLGTFNAATDDIRFDFRYKNHSQSPNAANNVWIRGDDQQSWIQVYDLYANQPDADGTYRLSSSIELSDSLAAHGQNFSSSFQVRWGQWGQILTADDNGGAGYTFDDIRLYKVTSDIQLVSIDTPTVASCALSATTQVKITVRNSANTTVSGVPAILNVDGSVIATETLPDIPANTSISYIFTATANLAAPGTHTIQAWVHLSGDNYRQNDTATVVLVNSALITSFPYLENFESGTGGWYTNGKNDSWEYGTPASAKINRAASGSKAWKTRSVGDYNDLETSYLYSPCFNTAGMTSPTMSLSIALDLEDCGSGLCDGAYVEYSSDGKTWTRLGAYNQSGSTNWYNKNYSNNNLWSIQNYTHWHVATVPLPAGMLHLQLRFVMSSDLSVNKDGIAIDDIHIYDNIHGIYTGATMGSPVTQTISGGTNWIDFTSGGQLIASVQPNNQSMGSTDVQAYINTGAVRYHNNQYYHDRNITIKPANNTLTDSAIVRFYFLDNETEALINATGCGSCYKPSMAYELGVSKYDDPNDNFENGTIIDDVQGDWLFITAGNAVKVPFDKGYYAEFKVKDFSEFWLNNGGFDNDQTLPLQLLSFNATRKPNKDVLTTWVTAAELNVNRFELQVARGNADYQQNHFSAIATISSQGNSQQDQSYSFTDAEANKSGVRYYRLKIIDNDGSFSYSAIRPVVFSAETTWVLYPNPTNGDVGLTYQATDGDNMQVKIYDANGRIVQQYSSKANGFVQKININLGNAVAAGLYLIEASAGEKKQVFRLVKQ